MSQAHHEIHLEGHIVNQLVEQGWIEGSTEGYDTETTLYSEDVLAWIQKSQPKQWEKLQKTHGPKAEKVVLTRLDQTLVTEGTVSVLRKGFSVAGCGHIDMSQPAPEDGRNETVVKRYKLNQLRVVRQLKYHPAREFALDLGMFINGIAVATAEIKTEFTQSVEDAKAQYKLDRKPYDPKSKRKEPLFTFKRGAVVHFALDEHEIYMTTRLAAENTYFLPFNKGNKGHKGNAPVGNGYPIAYFWREVLKPSAWLRIFHNFMFIDRTRKQDAQGNWHDKETMIFPRFHQWEAVNKMVEDAQRNGPGMSYLCEHSAGSGKTATIAWTAHDLTKLREPDGRALFDSVIIVTDRTVLDTQLQEAVKQIDHKAGVITNIGRHRGGESKSQQLTRALLRQDPIIVVTIQTFPYAMEAILTNRSLADKRFAVIMDEAHNSQTGTSASKLQATLSLKSAEQMRDMTVEELLEAVQKSRKRQSNISHFAFTATPKHSTMMLFGRPPRPGDPLSDDNLPASFHIYPMRQAIEEGFILDVLKNYTPYSVALKLSQRLEDDKEVDKKAARRALAKWINLHPTNVTQKVEFIIEHFSNNVAGLLNGEAKAMVVTSSRAAAVRYKKAFDRYIEQHPEYSYIHTLVAFSGSLSGKEVNHPGDVRLNGDPLQVPEDAHFTEANMNPGAGLRDLRDVFDEDEYRVMVVANKFQTGFDQPKLVAMYVDKRIANDVEIVQTFSRLNRTYPGKQDTYIIDFVNDAETVKRAFRRYDSGAEIEAVEDPNTVYMIKSRLDGMHIYAATDLEKFKRVRAELIRNVNHSTNHHLRLYQATQRPADRFNDMFGNLRQTLREWESALHKARVAKDQAGIKRAEHERKHYTRELDALSNFKQDLGRFCRQYSYVAQLIEFGDADLESFAGFAHLLSRRLEGDPPEMVDVVGLSMTAFAIRREASGDGDTNNDEDLTLKPTTAGGSTPKEEKKAYLSKIIELLNQALGDIGSMDHKVDFVNAVTAMASENRTVVAQVENNPLEQAVRGDLPEEVKKAVVRAMSNEDQRAKSFSEMAKLLLSKDKQSFDQFTQLVYEAIKEGGRLEL